MCHDDAVQYLEHNLPIPILQLLHGDSILHIIADQIQKAYNQGVRDTEAEK